jgi:endonuclease/exonuclease/phosphatase (EEP) superfamily protein YafD
VHVFEHAQDNTYGMIFATRLEVNDPRFAHPTQADTPAFYATLATEAGRAFDVIGLHPRPPLPGQDTDTRDANIARAAERQEGDTMPALAMGDFNDVAWSRTTQRFMREGGFLDPRIGRGLFRSFPSKYLLLGWPLDHLVVSPDFTMGDVRILDHVGSDHRPLAARLCLRES